MFAHHQHGDTVQIFVFSYGHCLDASVLVHYGKKRYGITLGGVIFVNEMVPPRLSISSVLILEGIAMVVMNGRKA